jgi:peptidyl-tRNA hydrolase
LEDEDITVGGWVLREDGWYLYNPENGSYIRVLPYFKIRAYYLVGETEEEYVEIVDKRDRSYIKKIDRKRDTYKPSVDLVKGFGAINPDRINDARRFLAHYIEKVKEKRGVRIDFVGYKNIGNDWDIVVGGNGRYSRKEISFIFYGKEMENSDWYVPEVKGSEDFFKAVHRALFNLDDAPLHLTIAHFLSWVGREFIKERSLIGNINPILILVGDTGTGKSIRVKIATALYGSPNLFSFTNITQAGFNNNFSLIKTPFGIDEVIMKTANDERKLSELVYNITNIQGKMTFNTTYNPIDVPIALTGETENLLIDKAFSNFRGLNRRSIVIEMTDRWKENSNVLDDALDELQSHHGHILDYVRSLKEKDKKEIMDLMKGIQASLDLGDSNFKDLRKHLALSLAMFHHFYERYIGVNAEDVTGKVSAVINFVVEQINKKQVERIGESIDYVEEIINFIVKVEEAMNNKKVLKGLSYDKLCNTIGYTPSNRVGELLKKFFWKRYGETKRKSTKLRFVLGVLIVNPFLELSESDRKFIFETDRSRLEALTDEELKIWADVLRIRYNDEMIEKIVNELGNKRLKEILKIDDEKKKTEEPDGVEF